MTVKEEEVHGVPIWRCQICGILGEEASLVRDHDHHTARFRGVLCRDCNYNLGIFVKEGVPDDREYAQWATEWYEEIVEYLKEDYGFGYYSKRSEEVKDRMREIGYLF